MFLVASVICNDYTPSHYSKFDFWLRILLISVITMNSHECHELSNQGQMDLLQNNLSRLRIHITWFLCAECTGESPHKGPVTRKAILCRDVIMPCLSFKRVCFWNAPTDGFVRGFSRGLKHGAFVEFLDIRLFSCGISLFQTHVMFDCMTPGPLLPAFRHGEVSISDDLYRISLLTHA